MSDQDNWKDYADFKNHNSLIKSYYNYVLECVAKGVHVATESKQIQAALDIACGFGDSAKLLLPYTKNIDAVDISEKLISQAKSNESLSMINFYCQDFLAFDNKKQYDLITAVWFHNQLLKEHEQLEIRDKIVTSLNNEGRFVFLFPSDGYASDRMQQFCKLAGCDQAVIDQNDKFYKLIYSFNKSGEWAEMVCWQPMYLYDIYKPYFDLQFVGTKKVLGNCDYFKPGYNFNIPFEVMIGIKK